MSIDATISILEHTRKTDPGRINIILEGHKHLADKFKKQPNQNLVVSERYNVLFNTMMDLLTEEEKKSYYEYIASSPKEIPPPAPQRRIPITKIWDR